MRIYTYNQLKESKLIYDKKMPPFGLIMTFLTCIFVIAAIIWAAVSTKTYVVKATGLISDERKINVMNSVAGEIESLSAQEGQVVKNGDVILTIDSYQVRLQITQIQTMVDLYEEKIALTIELIRFVENYKIDDDGTQENPFNADNPNEMRFYADAATFLKYVQQQTQDSTDDTEFTQETVDEIKTPFLSQQSIFINLEQYGAEKAQKESQLKMYEDSISEYTVRALADGVVHLSAGITQGTVISAGTLLGSIVSGEQENLYIDTVVSATERSKLMVGSKVEIAVRGVSQTDYGILTGKLSEIDNDSTQTQDGQVYYRVKVALDKTELTDKKGNCVKLTTGMLGECRIKYDETTWLKWAIEQIGIKFR